MSEFIGSLPMIRYSNLLSRCSTIAMTVISAYNDHYNPPGVSQTINIFYHSEALSYACLHYNSNKITWFILIIFRGTKLRIVNRSSESGRDSNSGRTQVWLKFNIARGAYIICLLDLGYSEQPIDCIWHTNHYAALCTSEMVSGLIWFFFLLDLHDLLTIYNSAIFHSYH